MSLPDVLNVLDTHAYIPAMRDANLIGRGTAQGNPVAVVPYSQHQAETDLDADAVLLGGLVPCVGHAVAGRAWPQPRPPPRPLPRQACLRAADVRKLHQLVQRIRL